MTRPPLPALALLPLLALSGCISAHRPTPPAETALAVRTTASEGATVTSARAGQPVVLDFPAHAERPAALLTLADTNLNDRLGLALTLTNPGPETVRVYADLNGDTWVRGDVVLPPGRTGTLQIFARRKQHAPALAAKFPNMHGLPGGRMSLWAGIEEPIVASSLRIFVVKPATAARLELSAIRPFGSSRVPDRPDLFPFIDRYGQYKHGNWPGKVHTDADLTAARVREDTDLAAHAEPADWDRYGGWATGPQLRATGHFRVEKNEGKWWLVDPEGRLFWSHGLDVVSFDLSATQQEGRERFFEEIVPEGNFLLRNLQKKYGRDWREVTYARLLQRIPSWGLNTLGGVADPAITARQRLPYTLLVWSAGRHQPIDPASPAWTARLRQSLAAAAAQIKDDPWCIGFFVDNENHFSYERDWWDTYYRQVSTVARELLPNKLYLGSRLDYHDWPEESAQRHEIVRLAAQYCDVISFNFYKFTLDDVALPAGVDRPALIGEFHFGALDRGLFHTGLRSVPDQSHRADAYRAYVTSALRNPAIVGAHWFQCYDESTTGRFDGENYQIGFLDICDTPYVETVAAARDIGGQLYQIRRGK